MNIFLFPLLFPISLLVRVATALDRFFRSRQAVSLGGFTVSVGNLTVGGTGKTPWVMKLVEDLQTLDQRPAILSRGYRGALNGSGENDEVLLMQKKCPTVPIGIGPDRIKSATELKRAHNINAYVLDDGFQHWPIKREVDLVCIDATRPWGGGFLFPMGLLREPLSSLRRAHVFVITRCDLVSADDLSEIESGLRKEVPRAEIFQSRFTSILWSPVSQKEMDPKELYGRRVLALSSIGHPRGFEAMLERFGAQVIPLRFRDHHNYSKSDIASIQKRLSTFDGLLVTTEKDWMKLQTSTWSSQAYVLKIAATLSVEEDDRWMKFLRTKISETKIPA